MVGGVCDGLEKRFVVASAGCEAAHDWLLGQWTNGGMLPLQTHADLQTVCLCWCRIPVPLVCKDRAPIFMAELQAGAGGHESQLHRVRLLRLAR